MLRCLHWCLLLGQEVWNLLYFTCWSRVWELYKRVTKTLPLLGPLLAGPSSKLYILFRGFILLRAERGHSVVPPLAFFLQGRTLSRQHCLLGESSLLDPWALNMSKSFLNTLGLCPLEILMLYLRWAVGRKKESKILSRNGSFEKLGKIIFTAVSLFCNLVRRPQALF